MMNRVLFVERSGELRWLARLRTATSDRKVNRMVLGKPAIEGESPVCENRKERQDPEYYETRGTL